MALLSRTERQGIKLILRGREHLSDEQYGSLVRELQLDDWSTDEGSVDTKLGLARKK